MNKRHISNEEDSGFLWFLEESYQFIKPVGFSQHYKFLKDFLPSWRMYRDLMEIESTNTHRLGQENFYGNGK